MEKIINYIDWFWRDIPQKPEMVLLDSNKGIDKEIMRLPLKRKWTTICHLRGSLINIGRN